MTESMVQIHRDGKPWGVPVTHSAGVRYLERQPRREVIRFDLVYVETGRLASYVLGATR